MIINNFKLAESAARILQMGCEHRWNRGEWLKEKVRKARRARKCYQQAFDNTYSMPCGYQDAAGDRLETAACEEFELKCAFLIARYGSFPRKLDDMFAEAIDADDFEDGLPV